MSEIDILNKVVGGIAVKDMTTTTFYQVVAKRLNGVKAYNPSVVELTRLVTAPVMTRKIPDEQKLQIIAKLKSLNIEF